MVVTYDGPSIASWALMMVTRHSKTPHHGTSAVGGGLACLAMLVLLVHLARRFYVHDGGTGGLSGRAGFGWLNHRWLNVAVHRRLPTQIGPLVEQK